MHMTPEEMFVLEYPLYWTEYWADGIIGQRPLPPIILGNSEIICLLSKRQNKLLIVNVWYWLLVTIIGQDTDTDV